MNKIVKIELSEEDILLCMRGLHTIWDNYGLSMDDLKTLIKLEKSVGMNDTEEYLSEYAM